MPKRILFDTDPGIDDACAILPAVAEVSVEGLSVVHGNCSLAQATTNALLSYWNWQTPITFRLPGDVNCRSSSHPCSRETHGETGLGYARLSAPRASPSVSMRSIF